MGPGPKVESGLYIINLGDSGGEFSVYCDMEERLRDGGWTVIQRRVPGGGSNDFDKDWRSYKNGFGVFHGNFWLGLEKIHRITSTENHELYIGMEATLSRFSWARYRTFHVGNEASMYSLTLDGYEGTANDAFEPRQNNGDTFVEPIGFSTFDRNNIPSSSCARNDEIVGGWWLRGCDVCNLNARYYSTAGSQTDGINWQLRYHISVPILRVVMAIRPSA